MGTKTHTYIRECVATYAGQARKITKQLSGSRDLARFARRVIGDVPVEHMVAIAVDGKNRPIAWYRVAQGGSAAAVVEPASMFRPAIVAGATGLALVHNHPSGESTPSAEDIALTLRVKQSAELLGLRLLDHVVLGADDHTSFLDRGWL